MKKYIYTVLLIIIAFTKSYSQDINCKVQVIIPQLQKYTGFSVSVIYLPWVAWACAHGYGVCAVRLLGG